MCCESVVYVHVCVHSCMRMHALLEEEVGVLHYPSTPNSFEMGSLNETETPLEANKSRHPPASALPALALAMPAFCIGAGDLK